MAVYRVVLDVISGSTYNVQNLDAFIADLLTVTNGIVVPSVSVAFGTLTAITIQSLRQRQISIRALLNKEACGVRSLYAASKAVFAGAPFQRERVQLALLTCQV